MYVLSMLADRKIKTFKFFSDMSYSERIAHVLKKHKVIGLDFDGTLFDSSISRALCEYVIANQGVKDFYIVTHRTHQLVPHIWDDFRAYATYGKGPRMVESMFAGVCTPDDDLYVRFKQRQDERKNGLIEPDALPTPDETAWLFFKGAACKRTGATIMVDDLPGVVQPGCLFYNIEFIDVNSIVMGFLNLGGVTDGDA
jgi:hypothetical protein